MSEKDFIPSPFTTIVNEGTVTWEAPSNIALVKYWGKKEIQLPANPSLSFTLSKCTTTTTLRYKKLERRAKDFKFTLLFEGKEKESFHPKINKFFKNIEIYAPYLKEYEFTIETSNSFPHSSGIASSASGMSALALGVMSLEKALNPEMKNGFFYKKASFLARLGSGSACRSQKGSVVVWGEHDDVKKSSDLYGVSYKHKVDEVFEGYQDTILLIDRGEKVVSSTVGHDLMHYHPFAKKRFKQAHEHLGKLREILRDGDLTGFMKLVESEALTLHAMMMTSMPYFILMKPNTLEVIQKVWQFRNETGLHLCFTLDAGANVHLLYPKAEKEQILEFIKNELVAFCENGQYICDEIGEGAMQL